MAITNKAAIQALIDAYTANITLYITSNNNKEITGAQLKQILDESSIILEDLKDSYFNLLDEPRTALSVSFTALNALDWDVLPTEVKGSLDELAQRVRDIEEEANQTAFETPYSPTSVGFDWLPEGDPTEVRGALDILAARTGKNPAETIAYIATNGSDTIGEYEVGNQLKPFLTPSVALSALPSSNCSLVFLTGVYSSLGTITILKSDFLLDIRNCEFTETKFSFSVLNASILAENCKIQNTSLSCFKGLNASNVRLYGGFFESVISVVENITSWNVYNAFFSSALTGIGFSAVSSNLYNCEIKNTSSAVGNSGYVFGALSCKLYNCLLEHTGVNGHVYYNTSTTNTNVFYNCNLKSVDSVLFGNTSAPINGYFNKCYLKSSSSVVAKFNFAEPNYLFFNQCEMIGETDCVDYSGMNKIRVAGTTNVFKECTMYANTGVIFKEPVSYNVGDLGVILSINNTYNQVFAPNIPAKLIEHNKFEYVGLQVPTV